MRKFRQMFLMFFLIFAGMGFSQICGISGSKLTVPDAGTIVPGVFEFEPSLTVTSYSSCYNQLWDVEKFSASTVQSCLSFRMTMGINENIEIGSAFPATADIIAIGSKIRITNSEEFSFTFASGVQLPANNTSENDSALLPLNYGYSAGIINSIVLSEDATIDVILSGTIFTAADHYNKLFAYGAAYGHYISDKICAVFELTGVSTFNGALHSTRLAAAPGFTYLFSERLLFVLGFQYDFAGKNDYRTRNILTAFTMKF